MQLTFPAFVKHLVLLLGCCGHKVVGAYRGGNMRIHWCYKHDLIFELVLSMTKRSPKRPRMFFLIRGLPCPDMGYRGPLL